MRTRRCPHSQFGCGGDLHQVANVRVEQVEQQVVLVLFQRQIGQLVANGQVHHVLGRHTEVYVLRTGVKEISKSFDSRLFRAGVAWIGLLSTYQPLKLYELYAKQTTSCE